jgi:hypothetical protein
LKYIPPHQHKNNKQRKSDPEGRKANVTSVARQGHRCEPKHYIIAELKMGKKYRFPRKKTS